MRSIVALAALIGTTTPLASAGEHSKATVQLLPHGIEKVLENYVNGAQRGDEEMLSESFETNVGVMYAIRQTDSEQELRATPFGEFISFFSEPNQLQARGNILAFDVVEDHMAFVKFEYTEGNDRYIDYLTLMNRNDNWVIVSKVYLYQPGQATGLQTRN